MEKDIKLGDLGELDLKIDKGVITFTAKGDVSSASLKMAASLEMDVGLLVDKLEALVEAKYPVGAPIEKAVFAILKSGLQSV